MPANVFEFGDYRLAHEPDGVKCYKFITRTDRERVWVEVDVATVPRYNGLLLAGLKHFIVVSHLSYNDESTPFKTISYPPKGWRDVLLPILHRLMDLRFDQGFDIEIAQVKEKFHDLRLYITGSDAGKPEVVALVKLAERRCKETCQMCGLPGHPRPDLTSFGFPVLCDGCVVLSKQSKV